MILLPAIDLVGGRCVRLMQGDFARETSYSAEPLAALAAFADGGATEAHLVDLDGAKARSPRQHDLFMALAASSGLTLQVAGGVRSADHVRRLLNGGIERVVLGSLAIDDPSAFDAILSEFGPGRITLALDVRIDEGRAMVSTHGWLSGSGKSLDDVMLRFPSVRHLLVTDISRDGMLEGPNLELTRQIARDYPAVELQASGGVAALGDLDRLRVTGAARAIVGKAIWEKRFTVAEGVAHAHG